MKDISFFVKVVLCESRPLDLSEWSTWGWLAPLPWGEHFNMFILINIYHSTRNQFYHIFDLLFYIHFISSCFYHIIRFANL